MTTETAAEPAPAEGLHNHPPRCCCSTRNVVDGLDGKWHQTGEDDAHPIAQCEAPWCARICPACPEHGDLAPGVDCPQCHQAAGRPHTDYCPLRLARDQWATTNREYPGQPHIRTCGDCGQPEYPFPVVCRRCFGYGVVDGELCPACVRPACTSPASNHGDGRGCDDDNCPRHGNPER